MTTLENSYGGKVQYGEIIENMHILKNLFRSRTSDCVVSTLAKTENGWLSVVGTPSEGWTILSKSVVIDKNRKLKGVL